MVVSRILLLSHWDDLLQKRKHSCFYFSCSSSRSSTVLIVDAARADYFRGDLSRLKSRFAASRTGLAGRGGTRIQAAGIALFGSTDPSVRRDASDPPPWRADRPGTG